MNSYDRWAHIICEGDWFTDRSFHPLHQWHFLVSDAYFQQYPDARASLHDQIGSGVSDRELGRALWDRWYGGKTFHTEPLYPYALALTYKLLSPDVRWVFLWQLLLGVLTNVLIFLITRHLFGDIASLAAAILAVGFSPLLFHEMVLQRTALISFSGLSLVYAIQTAIRSDRWARWLVTGVALGLALLLKSIFQIFVLFVVCFLVLRFRGDLRKLVLRLSLVIAGLAIGMAPTMIRNAVVGIPFMGMSSVNSITFISGNLPDYLPELNTWPNPKDTARVMGITDGQFLPAIRATLDAHESITHYLVLLAKKFLAIWSWYEMPNNANFYYYGLYSSQLRYLPVTFAIVAPLSIVGMGLAIRRFSACGPLFMLATTHLAAMLISLVQSRYRIPLAVALIPFAALALARLGQYLLAKQFFAAAATGLTVVLLCVWILRPLPDELPLIRAADYAPLTKWHVREKGYDETRKYLTRVLSIKPDRHETMVLLAGLELAEQHFDRALSYSKKALKIAPDHTNAILYAGVSYFSLKQYDQAGQAFKKLIHLDPTSSQHYVNLLAVYLKQKNYADGLPLAEDARQQFPNNPHIQDYTARILKMSPGQGREP